MSDVGVDHGIEVSDMKQLETVGGTVTCEEESPAASARPQAHLFLLTTCGSSSAASSRHLLDGVSVVLIGRGEHHAERRITEEGRPELRLSILDHHMSSAHARVCRTPGGWVLVDGGSKNGSFVNGCATRETLLADGDVIRAGSTLLMFRAAVPTRANAARDVEAHGRATAFSTLVPGLAQSFDALAAAATTNVPVTLVSETGTGKELTARAVHSLSCRSGAFVPVNCAALPSTLAESVLFGHKRGSFSGASTDHPGLFRSADGGTLLLDEIGDMPLPLQPALLRALQAGEILPVGAGAPVTVDARIVAATNCDLERAVREGRFREDLFARLEGFIFRLPPLRERREDIGMLTASILRRISEARGTPVATTPDAMLVLLRYAWPRNIRELEKTLTRAALFAERGVIEVAHLSDLGASMAASSPDDASVPKAGQETMKQVLGLLVSHRGNVAAVAEAMGTSRSQVHRWSRRFGIDLARYRRGAS
ncbi:MAG: sigma-54 dependent transcriptional regulator [Myxococcales bacterium]|nr:sigma-54 dependent transcriptional regulator [Myxococcales bacterium]